jgi:hypothetical protein
MAMAAGRVDTVAIFVPQGRQPHAGDKLDLMFI